MKHFRRGKATKFCCIPLATFGLCLSSCFKVPNFSKGYDYSFWLMPIEIAYYLEKDRFRCNEGVNIHISYGHSPVVDNVPAEKRNLPFCLFLDYGNKEIENENDYKQYNGFELIEEIDPKIFYTDDYLYSQPEYDSKRFNHTTSYTIPYRFFDRLLSTRPHNLSFTFVACQLYRDNNGIIDVFGMKSAEISLDFSINRDSKSIRVIF